MEAASDRVRQRLRNEFEKHDTSLRSLYGDGWNAPPLEQDEFQILTAASLLGGEGTDSSVYRKALEWGGSDMLALAFDSLEEKGLIVSLWTPDQGRQRLKVTELGERALARAKVEGRQLVKAREGVAEEKEPEKATEIDGGGAERIR
jgi:DNA-binding MarR family transcriptional regulator